jgi:hypothetical protein
MVFWDLRSAEGLSSPYAVWPNGALPAREVLLVERRVTSEDAVNGYEVAVQAEWLGTWRRGRLRGIEARRSGSVSSAASLRSRNAGCFGPGWRRSVLRSG